MRDAPGNASWPAANIAPGNIGFGVWGDCATNGNVAAYNPVADDNGLADGKMGQIVAISGIYAIIVSYRDDMGADTGYGSVNIYKYDGTNWIWMQKITDATGAAYNQFGYSVAVAGSCTMIGAKESDISANANQGSVSIYQCNP